MLRQFYARDGLQDEVKVRVQESIVEQPDRKCMFGLTLEPEEARKVLRILEDRDVIDRAGDDVIEPIVDQVAVSRWSWHRNLSLRCQLPW